MKSKTKVHIIDNIKSLENAWITITPCNDILGDDVIRKAKTIQYLSLLLKQFLTFLNNMIGAKTTTNYHITNVKNNTIMIPVYVYTNEEAKMDPFELVKKRVNTVRDFVGSINWDNVNKFHLWVVRSLSMFGINVSNAFQIKTYMPNTDYQMIDDVLLIKYPNIVYPSIKRYELKDGSMINVYVDPYIEDYGLFLNLSVKFDEMGMSYNALHLYEHLLTKPWMNSSSKDLIELNGCTYPVGICYVYTIHRTEEELKIHMNDLLKWLYESREKGFWKKQDENIQVETMRTISETRSERSLTSMGRSDHKAYDLKYNRKIFEYWSNKKYNILISSPEDIKINVENLERLGEKYKLRSVQRPKNPVFKHFPIDVLRVKNITGERIRKMLTKEIISNIVEGLDSNAGLYGVDCEMKNNIEDLSVWNSVLHPLLYLNEYMTEDELNTYVKNNVVPFSAKFFSEASINLKFGAEYMKREMKEEL